MTAFFIALFVSLAAVCYTPGSAQEVSNVTEILSADLSSDNFNTTNNDKLIYNSPYGLLEENSTQNGFLLSEQEKKDVDEMTRRGAKLLTAEATPSADPSREFAFEGLNNNTALRDHFQGSVLFVPLNDTTLVNDAFKTSFKIIFERETWGIDHIEWIFVVPFELVGPTRKAGLDAWWDPRTVNTTTSETTVTQNTTATTTLPLTM